MKFAKELEEDLVPEWRAKYLNYKAGKKKIKAVSRALRNVNQSPRTPGRRRPSNLFSGGTPPSGQNPFTSYPFAKRKSPPAKRDTTEESPRNAASMGTTDPGPAIEEEREENTRTLFANTPPMNIPERRPLRGDGNVSHSSGDVATSYGSIIPTPPQKAPSAGPTFLELPDPALNPSKDSFSRHNKAWKEENAKSVMKKPPGNVSDPYHVGQTNTPRRFGSTLIPTRRSVFRPRRINSTPGLSASDPRPPLFKRMFSTASIESPYSADVPLEAYRELDAKQEEFYTFLDMELEKIEAFYKMKENEANDRLEVLRNQLHEMRDRRLEEVIAAKQAEERKDEDGRSLLAPTQDTTAENGHDKLLPDGMKWMKPLEGVISRKPHFGKTTKAMEQLGSPQGPNPSDIDTRRDYVRRPDPHKGVPYRSAKRKLKQALQEFYRGLELLKSYALLNRTAFRKINKKYDKAVNARPTGRYMSENVNKAWFVQSEVIEGHIVAVEDLYSRYFERGNHKIAVGKLRSKRSRSGDYSRNSFLNGLFLAGGLVFGMQGLVYGSERLKDPDPAIRTNASYLLQIYGGVFLAIFHFLFFCFDCKIWSSAKINYVFIFEYDARHVLDWRQLAELPSLFLFLEGVFLWLNFGQSGVHPMFLYWPVILIGLIVILMFLPGPILYHRSREWWAYSNWRLLLAGLYPVEFRDFFLGDMYCSQTYAMGNIELLFCLYARSWNDPVNCNSSHSRLLGFFSTLPGIWRALQCLRRFNDTRNWFPHLVNCGKYTFTILYYMTLSLYRIHEITHLRALFIFCAFVNGIYCSVWDLAMDWSLCNPYARYPFLRDRLGYRTPWVYYIAMIIDPILRFNWIFYAIYSKDVQHSAVLSFFVSFSEIWRRGMWSLFRVENEHCTNVGRFRASRDIPLPYEIPSASTSSVDQSHPSPEDRHTPVDISPVTQGRPHASSGADLERMASSASGTLRQRKTGTPQPTTLVARGIARVGTIMAQAHAQDFERKKRPGLDDDDKADSHHHDRRDDSSDEDEGDAEDDQEVMDAERMLSRVQG